MKRLLTLVSIILACSLNLSGQNENDSKSDVLVGPWVTNVTETSASIIWTSNHSGMGWVELSDGTKVYDTFAGRRTFGRIHRVNLKRLTEGETITYRVGGDYLLDDSNPRYPKFGDSWADKWYDVKLFDKVDDCTIFSIMNDIHLNTDAYTKLTSKIDLENSDLIFLNGDIASTDNYTDIDKLVKYEIEPLGEYAHRLPIMFARGNHEGRGTGIKNVLTVYPNNVSNDGFYYTFRDGQAAFIVFDAGETGTDRSILYTGDPVFEDYISEQIEWAKVALNDENFADAPLKICLAHVPFIDHENKNDFQVHRYMNQHIMDLLNEAGIDIMIGADLHVNMECLPGTMNNNFPIIVNKNCERLDFKAENGKMDIQCFDENGKETYKAEFNY